MNNKKRDVKFIIYQALYIFVVCIVAIKGASLDLVEVDEKKMVDPGWTYVDTTNKVLIDKSELSKMIVFDSTRFVLVSIDDYKKNPVAPPIQVAGISGIQTPQNDNTTKNPDNPVTPTDNQTALPPMVLGGMQLIQYHDNIISNKNGYPITVKGITIPANSTKTVRVEGDATMVISSERGTATVSTIENKKPMVDIRQIAAMSGDEVKLSKLQQTVGFRVTISDDFTDQLDVKITGAVTTKVVKQTSNEIVVDVTLNAFASKAAFDNYTNSLSQNTYKTTFTVTVKDKIAPHSIQRIGQFSYTEW